MTSIASVYVPPRARTGRAYSQADLDSLDRLARLLDGQWRIPGTSIRFGLDAMVGLVPGIGDAATGVVSTYIVYRAWRMGVPLGLLALMAVNIGLDTVLGSIPVAGSVFDVFFRANQRNMWLLRRHFARNASGL